MTPVAVGKPIDRAEGRLKVTGAARYAADADVKGVAYAALVQATIARGMVTEVDSAAAEKSPGVLAVLSHKNSPPVAVAAAQSMGESRIPLSDAKVHYAGQVVTMVVADTFERARAAARLVKVTYAAETPDLPDPEPRSEIAEPGPQLYARGDVNSAFGASPAVLVDELYVTPLETHNPMEPSATVAAWDGDKLTLHDATQWITGVQGAMAAGFGLERGNVRIIAPFLGGAFGCKAMIWPHQVLAALAAKAVDKPVKLVLTRQQMFTSCGYRPRCTQKVKIAAEKDGKLIAISHETAGYTSGLSGFAEPAGAGSSRITYACPNVYVSHKLSKHNIAAATFMRAPGETPGMYALEAAMDELAYALKIDPVELRMINWADKNPASGKPWSSNGLKKCYEMGAEKFGWKRRSPQPRSMKDGDLLIGWGMATASFPGNRSQASAKVRMLADGRVIGSSSTHDMGTGSYTIFAQVAADAVGVPIERVTFELGDSALPRAPMSAGSNTAATVGQATLDAGRALKKKLIEAGIADAKSPLFGLKVEDVDIVEGRLVTKTDAGKSEPAADVVKRSGAAIEAEAASAPNREQMGKFAFNSFGAHFCEVKVNEPIGRVRVTRMVSVMDIGRVMNAKTAHSQVVGGVVMGIGMALMEHTVLDPRTGYPVNSNFADYAIPVNADIGALEAYFTDEPDPHINELGCRGVGEVGITGVAAAIANAVFHATGKRIRELPITPDKLL